MNHAQLFALFSLSLTPRRRESLPIIFLDEIDTFDQTDLVPSPFALLSHTTLTPLGWQIGLFGLVEEVNPLLIIAATNHPHLVDPRLRVPGRLVGCPLKPAKVSL